MKSVVEISSLERCSIFARSLPFLPYLPVLPPGAQRRVEKVRGHGIKGNANQSELSASTKGEEPRGLWPARNAYVSITLCLHPLFQAASKVSPLETQKQPAKEHILPLNMGCWDDFSLSDQDCSLVLFVSLKHLNKIIKNTCV